MSTSQDSQDSAMSISPQASLDSAMSITAQASLDSAMSISTASQDLQDPQDSQDPQGTQDSQDPQGTQDSQDPQGSQPWDAWESWAASLDFQASQDSHAFQDSQDSQDSQASQDSQDSDTTIIVASQVSSETDSLSSGQKDSPETKATQAINVPVQQNTPERPIVTAHVKTLKYGKIISCETHSMVFKRGYGEYEKHFYDDVRRYGGAFLNSGGGRLVVGVDNHGLVQGLNIHCKLQERLQLKADGIFQKFNPPVQPDNFTLEFLRVEKEDGEDEELKVLSLTLTPPTVLRKLYQTDTGEVYRWREGSLETMDIRTIQEWSEQKWTDEVGQLTKAIIRLTEEGEQKKRSNKMEQLANENEGLKELQTEQQSSQVRPALRSSQITVPLTKERARMAGVKRKRIQSGGAENRKIKKIPLQLAPPHCGASTT